MANEKITASSEIYLIMMMMIMINRSIDDGDDNLQNEKKVIQFPLPEFIFLFFFEIFQRKLNYYPNNDDDDDDDKIIFIVHFHKCIS